ncbi:MAG: hypothetical protein WCY48_01295 [Candidatus Caldatribacteriota bacterium]
MKIFLYLTIILFYSAAFAQIKGPEKIDGWQLHIGSHTQNYKEVQTDTSGEVNRFEFNPVLGAGLNIPLSDNWKLLPEFSWVLPEFNEDSRIIKNIFFFRADLAYTLTDWLWLRAGTSFAILNQHGRGGKTTLDNGTDTSEFYYPDENHSSINNTFDLGLEFLYNKWSFRLQTYTYQIFKEESRQISYSLFLTRYWDL